MFKADILYTDEEHIYKREKIIDDTVFDDLKLKKIFEFCSDLSFDNIKADDLKYTIDILKSPCQLKKDILFRQEIFRQFLEFNPSNLINDLYTALSGVAILARIRESYDFAYGGENDIEYLKAVNYIFFIKSYIIYLERLHAIASNIKFSGNGTHNTKSGLYKFAEQLKLERELFNAPEISEPVNKLLSYFADKTNILGELHTQNGVFNLFNFDTDEKNITSTLPEKIPFLDLLKSLEEYLDIYKPENEAQPKTKSLPDPEDYASAELYMPDKYTNFEKRFILQLIYDEETENNVSFAPQIKEIIKIHDSIDITHFSLVFDQIKFYRTMCKAIVSITDNCENLWCYPKVYENPVRLEIADAFDPVLAVQKLAEYQSRHNTRNLPDKKISDIIPNGISFNKNGEKKNLYVITGPNNGGKTAFVRSIGAALIFFGAGAPIPAASAELSVGINVLTHFTANETHLKESGRLQHELARINEITSKSDNYSFVILNETFAGTNSVKALSLFGEFLDTLARIDFHGVYVTHFHNIAFFIEDMQTQANRKSGDEKYKLCDNLIAVINNDTGNRTYKILPMQPSDTSYSKDIVNKHNLTWEQMKENLNF